MNEYLETKVNPGDIVPGGFSYANNAIVQGDSLYLRDANGNTIHGREVHNGAYITVLDVGYSKQLALIQYAVSNDPGFIEVRQGYVTNATKIINYLNPYNWVNGSTPEPVYSTATSNDSGFGTLSPGEAATLLYKEGNRYHVVYDTSKGSHTKSGYVDYAGIGTPGGGSSVNPGDIVPGGFSYDNNAIVQGDSLYLRDANGNTIPGREVHNGDPITVLDVGYSKQLALIQYPILNNKVRQGYVTNATKIINYLNPYNWVNGSTPEPVYSTATSNDSNFGTLSPGEAATLLYKEGNRYHVVYDTSKGSHTKSGYVDYAGTGGSGGGDTDIQIPLVSHSEAVMSQYGVSGKGRALNVYKIGNGNKILFIGFALHGWEDSWNNDGLALVNIGNVLVSKLGDFKSTHNGLYGWTVYIAPCMNPDGVIIKGSHNGPGRCTVTTRIDMNRCFPYNFTPHYSSRNYTGPNPLGSPESVDIKNFIQNLSSQASEMIVIDGHGWLGFTQGNSEVGKYFNSQFGFGVTKETYAAGFLSSWANSLKNTKGVLLEYPRSTYSYEDVIKGNYIEKTFNAIVNILKNNPGDGGSGDGGSGDGGSGNGGSGNGGSNIYDKTFYAKGIINASSKLNVRSGPGTSYSIIGEVMKYDIVKIIAQAQTSDIGISYAAHVQDIGWQNWVSNGQLAGTTGKAKSMEALKINLNMAPSGLKVKYRAHVQDIGWQNWVSNGQLAGTTGEVKSMEAIECKLEGEYANEYTIEYRAHVQDIGWQNWVSNGQLAGTTGKAKSMEAIEIKIRKIN